MEHTETQSQQIIRDLLLGVRLTSLEALERYGCARLASRVNDLRNQGFDVKKETVILPNKKRIARYFLDHKIEPKVTVDSIGQTILFV